MGTATAARQQQLQLATSFGGGVDFWALVGDEVQFTDLAEAQRFVGLAEIASRMIEIAIDRANWLVPLHADRVKLRANRLHVRDTEFLLNFPVHLRSFECVA